MQQENEIPVGTRPHLSQFVLYDTIKSLPFPPFPSFPSCRPCLVLSCLPSKLFLLFAPTSVSLLLPQPKGNFDGHGTFSDTAARASSVNYMATHSCQHCINQLPMQTRMHKRIAADLDFKIALTELTSVASLKACKSWSWLPLLGAYASRASFSQIFRTWYSSSGTNVLTTTWCRGTCHLFFMIAEDL